MVSSAGLAALRRTLQSFVLLSEGMHCSLKPAMLQMPDSATIFLGATLIETAQR